MLKKRISILLMAVLVISFLTVETRAEENFAVKITEDEVILETAGITISQKGSWIEIGEGRVRINFSDPKGRVKGYVKFGEKQQATLLLDKKDHKIVSIICSPQKNVPDINGELTLEIRKGLPCLFIKAGLRNISKETIQIKRFFWHLAVGRYSGWKGGVKSYFTSDDKKKEYPYNKESWKKIGAHDWIYARGEDGKGLGFMISYDPFQGAGKHYLGWIGKGLIEPGKRLDMEAVIFPAANVKEVEDIYKKVKETKEAFVKSETFRVKQVLEAKRIPSPNIDGKVMEREWEKATRINQFVTPLDGQEVSQNTNAYIGYDDKNLYLAFVCQEEQMDKLKSLLKNNFDFSWENDV